MWSRCRSFEIGQTWPLAPPDGKTLAVGHHHDRVELLPVDGGAGKLLDATGIWSLAYSRDGAHLATGGTHETLLVWSARS